MSEKSIFQVEAERIVGRWYVAIGCALVLAGAVGGHFLQYVIGHDWACGAAALMGALGGSALVTGGLQLWNSRSVEGRERDGA